MGKEYIVYCDESDKKGKYYSNFYGGALIGSSNLENSVRILEAKKVELNLLQEIKWSKVTHSDSEKYIALMNCFFDGLTNNPAFKKAEIKIPKNQIAEIDSKKHVILQCLDVVLGSMSFRLNDKHLEKIPGKRRRAKRTVAKEKVYDAINKRIRNIYQNFNIGVSTSRQGNPENSWNHQYRHWLLKSENYTVDTSKGKNKKYGATK